MRIVARDIGRGPGRPLYHSSSAMAAAFEKNKSKIQAVFEHNLDVVVPRLHSVGLISESDRDQALNLSTDSSIRAADLTSTIETSARWWITIVGGSSYTYCYLRDLMLT